MNKEIIKAMNRKEKKSSFRNWWSKNGYKVLRVILFPLWLTMCLTEKIKNKRYSNVQWSAQKADEILNYYIPRRSKWNEETQELYFFDNGFGWSIKRARKYLKIKDRRFWKKFVSWRGGKIRDYLLDTFELEGFIKEVDCCEDGWTEIYFKKIS